jgi:hypothetical protein
MKRLSFAALALLGTSCATVAVGQFEMDKERWERDQGEIRSRASFESHCPADQLQLTVLTARQGLGPWGNMSSAQWAKEVGVTGCGHQAVYINPNGVWELNSVQGQPTETKK